MKRGNVMNCRGCFGYDKAQARNETKYEINQRQSSSLEETRLEARRARRLQVVACSMEGQEHEGDPWGKITI